METLWQDLRLAVRSLLKRPGFSGVIVLTLALGIGANSAIFSVLHAVVLSALPYREPQQLVALASKVEAKNIYQQPISYLNVRDWQAQNQTFAQMAAMRFELRSLTDGAEPERVSALRASTSLLALLGAQPALGRDFRLEEETPSNEFVALISHGLWQRRYGASSSTVGKTIQLDGKTHTIIGVLPEWLKQPGLTLPGLPPAGADVWIPLVPTTFEQDRSLHNLRAIARLKANSTLAQARADMDAVSARLEKEYPTINANISAELQPLFEQVVGPVQQALWMLAGAVIFVLLIACANVANLLLARAASRQGEFAIRAALGASRFALIRQMLAECFVLSFAGGLAGLLLAVWGVPLLTKMSAGSLPRFDEIGVNSTALWFTATLALLTGLICGMLPAWQAARVNLAFVIKDDKQGGGLKHRRWLNALVVSEMALTVVLLIGAGLLLKNYRVLSATDPGFRAERVLTVSVPLPQTTYSDQTQQIRFYERAFAALKSVPGVEATAATFGLPIRGFATTTFGKQGEAVIPGQEPVADYRTISPDYFQVMGMPVLQGRAFSERDTEKTADVIIINEELARRTWPGESAIGKRLQIAAETTRWREIVGIVGNAKLTSLQAAAEPAIYVPFTQNTWPSALRLSSLVVKTSSAPHSVASALRQVLRELDASLPVSQPITMEEILAQSLAAQRFNLTLLTLFAVVAGALALVGIYGVMSYSVSQRTRELGVRFALGAQRASVMRMIVREGARLAITGAAIGWLAALALKYLLASLLADFNGNDPRVSIFIGLGAVIVAMGACCLPARRAAAIDPIRALRAD